jgi:hypothetical protein
MVYFANGMAAATMRDVQWQKSQRSNSQGNCVELAQLPTGETALRNSRYPGGPVLIFTRAEIDALIEGMKNGEFDHLID